MFKVFSGLIISILTAQAAADINMSLVSSNQFKVGTNSIYQALINNPLVYVNVKAFGAVGDGITDDTTAIQNAYDSISATNGGVLFFPAGKWKYNLVVTKPNITISSISHVVDNTNILASKFIPANLANPIIQVGNDTGLVKGFVLQNVTLDGRTGSGNGNIGLYFAGGAFEWSVQNCNITYFTNCVKIQGGTTYPASLGYFNRVDGNPLTTITGARGWLILNTSNYPTSYTTEIVINNCHWNGPGSSSSNAYLMEVDSCEVKIVNDYFDINNGHGIKLSHNFTPVPFIDAINSNLDSGSSTNVAIEGYSNDRNFTGLASVNFQINGSWKELDGTIIAPLAQPITSILRKSSTVRGTLLLLNQNSGDGTSLIQFRDQINNLNPDIFAQNGSLNLRADIGGAVKFGSISAGTRSQMNETGAWFFFSVATNNSVYLDANSQLKPAPTATATLDFPSTSAGTSSDLTVTVTGAIVNDIAVVGPPATVNANSSFTAWVSSADTVTVRFNNYSASPIDPASATFKVKIVK